MDEQTDASQYTNEVLIADLLIRLASIEAILITKGVCDEQELQFLQKGLYDKITQRILNTADTSSNLKEFIASLRGNKN